MQVSRLTGYLALSCALCWSASPLGAITVTTAADELDFPAGPDVSLREALRDVFQNGTIDFDPSLDGAQLVLEQGVLNISRDLTIDASALDGGFTISGNQSSGIFTISGEFVTLENLTLTAGHAAGNGGAVSLTGTAQLTCIDCHLLHNRADIFGGAVYGSASLLVLDRTRVVGNSAANHGGGIYLTAGTFVSTDSTIADNRSGANGGGIYGVSNVNLQLNGTTVTGNSGGTGGGLHANSSTLFAENSTIADNRSTGSGAGLFSSGDLTIRSCTITGNRSRTLAGGIGVLGTAPSRVIANSVVAGNSAATVGPDLRVAQGSFTSDAGNFIGSNEGCEADFPAGNPNGAGDIVGTAGAPLDPVLSDLAYYGGVTETMHPSVGSPLIDAGGITTLTVDQRGLPRVAGGTVDIGAVETGPSLVVTTLLDEDDGVLGAGAGDSLRECIDVAGGDGEHIRFQAGLAGGVISLTAGGIAINGKTLFLDAGNLPAAVTVNAGSSSRIFNLANSTALATRRLSLTDGSVSSASGGAVLAIDADLSLIDAFLGSNAAGGGTINGGGAVSMDRGRLALLRCTFEMNSLANASLINWGGAVYAVRSVARVEDCTFNNQFCLGDTFYGGAIYASQGFVHIARSHFLNQQVSAGSFGRGGAVASAGWCVVEDSTFSDNNLSSGGGGSNHTGGALWNESDGRMLVTNCTVTGNTSIQHGGAITNDGYLELNHCTISDNTATNGVGGALRLVAVGGDTHLENTIVAGNEAGITLNEISFLNGTITAAGANLIGDNSGVTGTFPAGPLVGTSAAPLDPLLAPLGAFGGATPTRPPSAGSPALDTAVTTDASPPADQRSFDRIRGPAPDLGAYEAGNPAGGYPAWAAERIPAGEDDDFTGDAEGDNEANGTEYATGRDPWASEPGSIVSLDLAPKVGGGYIATLVFAYEPEAPDLRYTLERNTNLGGFSPRYRFTSATGAEQLHPSGNVTATLDPGARTITVVDTGIGSGGTEFYYRLETELLP